MLLGGNQFSPNISREVNNITGAMEEWTTLRNRRRAHLRSIMTINASAKRPKQHENWQINFSAHEENIINDNGNDPIVISPVINNFLVDRILVNDGSVVEVLIFV